MLQIAIWKRVLIVAIAAVFVWLAVPNLFYSRVEGHNDALKAIAKSGTTTPELVAQRDAWPGWMPSSLMNLGLDLRGGAHLLAEVHLGDVYKDRMDAWWPQVRDALRGLRDQVGAVRRMPSDPAELKVKISDPAGLDKAVAAVQGLATRVVSLSNVGATDIVVTGEGDVLTVKLSDAEKAATDDRTMQQSLEIIRRRVDAVGTREPTIQRQGSDRVLIEVPGIGFGRRTQGDHRHHRETDLPGGGRPDRRCQCQSRSRQRAAAVLRPEGRLLHHRTGSGGFGRRSGRRPALVRPERPAGGELPLRRHRRPQVRRLHLEAHRRTLRHRAGQSGDLGAADPERHHRRLGHHHRQFHHRGIHQSGGAAARRRPARRHGFPRGTHHRPRTRRRFDQGRQDRRAGRLGPGGAVHGRRLWPVRLVRQLRPRHQHRHGVRRAQPDRRHADAARHRRHRADRRHGGGCQRADLRTHPRRAETHQGPGPRHRAWL